MKVSSPDKEYPKDYETLLKEYKELEWIYNQVKKDLLMLQQKVGIQ